jgi:hypothetical protein
MHFLCRSLAGGVERRLAWETAIEWCGYSTAVHTPYCACASYLVAESVRCCVFTTPLLPTEQRGSLKKPAMGGLHLALLRYGYDMMMQPESQ